MDSQHFRYNTLSFVGLRQCPTGDPLGDAPVRWGGTVTHRRRYEMGEATVDLGAFVACMAREVGQVWDTREPPRSPLRNSQGNASLESCVRGTAGGSMAGSTLKNSSLISGTAIFGFEEKFPEIPIYEKDSPT